MISVSTRFETVFEECPFSELASRDPESLGAESTESLVESVSLLRALMAKVFIEGIGFAADSVADGVALEDLGESCVELHDHLTSILEDLRRE